MTPEKVYRRRNSIVTRKIVDEYVLIPVVSRIADMDSVYNLNEVAGFIWENLDGKKSLEAIASLVTEEFETDQDTAIRDVLECMKKLEELIESVSGGQSI